MEGIMKKSLLVVALLGLYVANVVAVDAGETVLLKPEIIKLKNRSLDEMRKVVSGGHIRVFSRDDLFAKPLDQEDLTFWRNTLEQVHEYVKMYCKNMLGITDKAYMNVLHTMEQANFELIKYIKIAQKAIDNSAVVKACANQFSRIKAELVELENTIQNLKVDKSAKENAKGLLYYTAFTIESIAIAAENHIYKYLIRMEE